MEDAARVRELEEALKKFEAEVERLKAEHTAAINAILAQIKARQLASIKQEIQQHA
jgi:hypothetical protein